MDSGPITVNRVVVAVFGPLITGISAWFAPWAADHLPGHPEFDPAELKVIGLGGALAGAAFVVTWLIGHIKHEARVHLEEHGGLPPVGVEEPAE